MTEQLRQHPWLAALVSALLVLTGIGVTVEIVDDNRPDEPRKRSVTIRVDGPDRDTKRDDVLTIPAPAQDLQEKAEEVPENYDLGGELRGADPEPVGLDPEAPLAAQEWPGCQTRFVRSFSARNEAVKGIGLHYTAGGNLPGLNDMLGLTAYSNNTANQVSWHFLIDREGHCFYSVPTNHKAWTISRLNSETVNIEVIGRGGCPTCKPFEPDYAGAAGMKKLSQVVRRIGRVHNIPMRLGATDGNCNITRRGIITHWMGGPCSGGHHDIRPFDVRAVVRRIARDAKPKLSDAERKRRAWQERHAATHAAIRSDCATRRRARGEHCTQLRSRNRAYHRLLER